MTITVNEIISDIEGLTLDTRMERDYVVEILESCIVELNALEYEEAPDEDLVYEIERDLREFE